MLAAAFTAAIIARSAPTVHDRDTLPVAAVQIRLFGVDASLVRPGQTPVELFAYEARDELARLARGRIG